jgi:hypothetical protein
MCLKVVDTRRGRNAAFKEFDRGAWLDVWEAYDAWEADQERVVIQFESDFREMIPVPPFTKSPNP